MSARIETFGRGEDAAYEDWVRQNIGYVLVERGEGFMLHRSRCGHLDLTPGAFTLTSKPRRCARTRQALESYAARGRSDTPALCQSCM